MFCTACKSQNHPLYMCDVFKTITSAKWQDHTRTHRLCKNCLSRGHLAHECSSSRTCKKCTHCHHTLLHDESNHVATPSEQQVGAAAQTTPDNQQTNAVSPRSQSSVPSTLLPTAYIKVVYNGREKSLHAPTKPYKD